MSNNQNEQNKATVIASLSELLATSYTVYLKTHNYHWNVKGPMFTTLHTLFETEYSELALAVDEIAERIRALGARAPGSYSEFASLSAASEDTGSPAATVMIENLVQDQQRLVAVSRRVVAEAEKTGDVATADLGTRRIDVHEKNAWMLSSHLEN